MALLDLVIDTQQAIASQYNRLVNAFVNTLGITADDQVNLGKLPLPLRTADGTIINGEAWVRTNEGQNGRLKVRMGGVTVPFSSIRQRVSVDVTNASNVTSTSYTDLATTSVSITTTGGRIRIGLFAKNAEGDIVIYAETAQAASFVISSIGYIRAVVGSVNLAGTYFGQTILHGGASGIFQLLSTAIPVPGWAWEYKPAAGTHLVKLQGRVSQAPTSLNIGGAGLILVVEEYDD